MKTLLISVQPGLSAEQRVSPHRGIINFSTLDPSRVVFTDASENLTSTGTVGVNQGGTGVTTFGGANTLLYTSAADTLAWVTNGTTGQYLRATTNGAPAFANILSSEITNNDFLVRVPAATANNTVAPTANGVVSMTLTGTTGTGTPHILDINDSTSTTQSYFDSTGALNTLKTITATTSGDTINGLIINSGSLSSVTGYSQGSGNFTVNGTGDVSLGTGSGDVTIGNTTGTFQLASSGGLNVSTTGGLTGVATIDTISVSDTALGFAGAGAISAGGTSNLTLNAGGSGLVQIGGTSTGNVELAGGVSATGCTIYNSTGDLACTGNITGSNTGTVGYWSRDNATSTLRTATDWDNMTLGGLLTATGGATIAGTTNINTSGSSATNIGTGAGSATTIGNATGTFQLISTGMNVSTAGVITLPGGQATDITTTGATTLKIAPGGAAAMTLGSATTTAINLTTDGTGDAELVLPGQSVSASEILNDTITATQLASTLTFSDGDFIDLSAIDYSTSTTEGLRLPSFHSPVLQIYRLWWRVYCIQQNNGGLPVLERC